MFVLTSHEIIKIGVNSLNRRFMINFCSKSFVIPPKQNSVYNCHNPKGIRLITRLRLGLSHRREHKLKHSFQDRPNLLCLCGNDVQTSVHFLFHCPTYLNKRMTFLNKIKNIDYDILELSDTIMTKTLLFGDSLLSDSTNTLI